MRCWNIYKLLSNNDIYKYIKSLKLVELLKKMIFRLENCVDLFLNWWMNMIIKSKN